MKGSFTREMFADMEREHDFNLESLRRREPPPARPRSPPPSELFKGVYDHVAAHMKSARHASE